MIAPLRAKFVALLLLTALVLQPSAEAAAEENFRELPGSQTDITSTISTRTNRLEYGERISYAQLLQHYRVTLQALEKHLPNIQPKAQAVLQPYRGQTGMEEPETFSAPYMLITPRNYDEQEIRIQTFAAESGGKRVPGLRVKSRLPAAVKKLPFDSLSELYVSDLNARAAGFNYGRLMLALSKNVAPAPVFDYNGVHEWSQHQRYRADDQVSRPIKLSNFAHTVGDTYVLSPHPDFALEFKNYRKEEITLTFFLWRERPDNKQAPDLIYQLLLAAPR